MSDLHVCFQSADSGSDCELGERWVWLHSLTQGCPHPRLFQGCCAPAWHTSTAEEWGLPGKGYLRLVVCPKEEIEAGNPLGFQQKRCWWAPVLKGKQVALCFLHHLHCSHLHREIFNGLPSWKKTSQSSTYWWFLSLCCLCVGRCAGVGAAASSHWTGSPFYSSLFRCIGQSDENFSSWYVW